MKVLALVSLGIWVGLVAFHDRFWRADERDDDDGDDERVPEPATWPAVTAVVPARNEADVIARAVSSLAAQEYAGKLRVVIVDDGSNDDTAEIARRVGGDRVEVIRGTELPRGWTGKLWAVRNGIEHAGSEPKYLWLTDADIEHAPDTLRSLVARSERDGLALSSLMAELRCESFAEKALVPAFVFFFQMLYPFRRVNRASSKLGAAAGGCMLVDRAKLEAAGGIAAIADALIDDCALGALMKKQGPIRLALTRRSKSIRPYGGFREIGAMISRSAYAQLRYSPLVLVGTLAGMALVYVNPPLQAIFGSGHARVAGFAAWGLMALSFQPMLRFYRRSRLWGAALPAIGVFYAGATWASAIRHWQGRGGMWKGRAQAQAARTVTP